MRPDPIIVLAVMLLAAPVTGAPGDLLYDNGDANGVNGFHNGVSPAYEARRALRPDARARPGDRLGPLNPSAR